MARLYRIVSEAEWRAFERDGKFRGSALDERDGFVHLSAAAQVAETLAEHYAGKTGLVLLALDGDELTASGSGALRWETSRAGESFPHFYGAVPRSVVTAATPLALDANGEHLLPEL